MIDSRRLDDLEPEFKKLVIAFIADYETRTGLKLVITSTFRDNEMQSFLYSKGRTAPGNIITNAKAGESFHNYHRALDAYPIIGGKIMFGAVDHKGNLLPEWAEYGKIAKEHGLAWAGDWHGHLIEYPHVQMPGITLAQLQQGTKLT